MSRDWTYLLWSEKTWNERAQTVVSWALAGAFGVGVFIGGLIMLGQALDGIARYDSEHRSCLQHATNGLEIEQCR